MIENLIFTRNTIKLTNSKAFEQDNKRIRYLQKFDLRISKYGQILLKIKCRKFSVLVKNNYPYSALKGYGI